MKAVFDTKPTSIYDDDVLRHYHFPRRYLGLVQQCVGDWIVLRRPRADGGNLAYFATAQVVAVDSDPGAPGMSYARLSGYLGFSEPAPWTYGGRYFEQALREMPPVQVGVYMRGRSVRLISDDDFANILMVGLGQAIDPRNAERLDVPPEALAAAADVLKSPPAAERDFRIVSVLNNRIIRDASFRADVYDAYDNRCAATGLQIFDNRGNSEVHAAHIWPVADGGPDVVQNGIALSATVHWLFDRHLISITDDYRLLIATDRVPPEFRALFERFGGQLNLPSDRKEWPHPYYLEKHREAFRLANR
jgi:putative restriction endonuclease